MPYPDTTQRNDATSVTRQQYYEPIQAPWYYTTRDKQYRSGLIGEVSRIIDHVTHNDTEGVDIRNQGELKQGNSRLAMELDDRLQHNNNPFGLAYNTLLPIVATAGIVCSPAAAAKGLAQGIAANSIDNPLVESLSPYIGQELSQMLMFNPDKKVNASTVLNAASKQGGKKLYKREKYRYDPEPHSEIVVEEQPYGVQPGNLIIKNGKLVSSDDLYSYSDNTSEPLARQIQQNYENAMHRRRDYTWGGIEYAFNDSGMIGIKGTDDNSALLSAMSYGMPDNSVIFHPTHFAPETIKGGARLIRDVAMSSQPTAFTVTPDLSGMLTRQGFMKIGEIPQPFDGKVVMKDILVNRAVTPKVIDNTAKLYNYDPELVTGLKAALQDAYKRMGNDGTLFYPQHSNYKIKDLIKSEK